jgi:hypothetical protein
MPLRVREGMLGTADSENTVKKMYNKTGVLYLYAARTFVYRFPIVGASN